MTLTKKLKDITPEPHGGNIYKLALELGIAEGKILDFSASINPLGIPKSAVSAIKNSLHMLDSYPDPDTTDFRLTVAQHIGLSSDYIICGNGSTELIYLIVRSLLPERVLLPAPTFSEYESALNAVMHVRSKPITIERFIMWQKDGFRMNIDKYIAVMSAAHLGQRSQLMLNSVDMAFICNPNNPTGELISKEDMLKICNAAKKERCWLVVDEAFIDYCPEHSVVHAVKDNPYLIVLRSMTKFYSLTGLRLGYAVMHPKLISAVKKTKEPWTVNTLAQSAGIAVLNDNEYVKDSLQFITSAKSMLEEGFDVLNIEYLPSSANFYLLRLSNARQVVLALRNKGILVRDCSNFLGLDDTFIRVAVKDESANMKLLKELAKL